MQYKMDNQEKLATQSTVREYRRRNSQWPIKRNPATWSTVREYRRRNTKWPIKRNQQHRVQLENTEGAMHNGQSRKTSNIQYSQRIPKAEYTMPNQQKLATQSTQDTRVDENKHDKNTTHYVFDTTTRKQTKSPQSRHEPSYKQLEAKTNRTCIYIPKSYTTFVIWVDKNIR